MSFRKRSDIIGAPPAVPRTSGIGAGRTPVAPPAAGAPVTRGAPPRSIPGRNIPGRPAMAGTAGRPGPAKGPESGTHILSHPGVRPSLITSYPTVSTGSSDLDKILLHQGLPLGSSLLVEESGTTDFASIILRVFASQGVVHNRVEVGGKRDLNSHIIVVGQPQHWANELPGLYKGSSKDQKKANILANQSKVSVSNLTDKGSAAARSGGTPPPPGGATASAGAAGAAGGSGDRDMKIAWRYGLNKRGSGAEADESADSSGTAGPAGPDGTTTATTAGSSSEHYTHQFDITQRLTPSPAAQEISFVQIPASGQFSAIVREIGAIVERQLKQTPSKVVRVVIPNLLNPSMYPPQFSSPSVVVPLMHSLRSLLRQHPHNVVLITSLSLDLYAKDSNLTYTLETLADAVIQLQPFNQEMAQLIEKAYKNEPAKIQHGLVHIRKVPHLSERGLMMIHDGEYAFRNGKKKFQIEEWGIPVEDDAKDEPAQTTKNIEF